MSLSQLSATQLAQQIKNKSVSCREVTDDFLERIEQVEDRVKSFVTVLPEEARRRADILDSRLAHGEDIGPLGRRSCRG
jgi:aspartyl-tRNA(Asn)/glutamyl-tRNA(Gln) amidotransferase subunit A